MEKFPEITFQSTGIEPVDPTHFDVSGDLTIKETTKSVTVPLEFTGAAVDPFGNHRIGLEGSTEINRKDWGVNWERGPLSRWAPSEREGHLGVRDFRDQGRLTHRVGCSRRLTSVADESQRRPERCCHT